jgi:hypothetical protein
LYPDFRSLVCVLIDEVESLTAARKASGSEPSDAIRVVNALLTQLDQIKAAPNVLILTTSNITGAIGECSPACTGLTLRPSADVAFVDRADIKQYIGPPSQAAIYQILYGCVEELVRAGVVRAEGQALLTLRELQLAGLELGPATLPSLGLWAAAGRCQAARLSGRALRKAPVLALALHSAKQGVPSTGQFLASLNKVNVMLLRYYIACRHASTGLAMYTFIKKRMQCPY